MRRRPRGGHPMPPSFQRPAARPPFPSRRSPPAPGGPSATALDRPPIDRPTIDRPTIDRPRIDPGRLPMTPDGYPAPRTRAELRAVLRQEAAYVRAWLCDRLPVADQPRAATDPRWLGDEVAAALEELRAPIGERGLVVVWPEELPTVAARDVPPGVRVIVEGYGQGVVRRGTAAAWPFVVDANLGESATSWEGVLGVASYVAIVGAAAARRAHEVGDLEILDDAERSDAAPLQVRLRLRDRRLDGAFRAAQAVFAALRAPARRAEEGARREVDRALAALTA